MRAHIPTCREYADHAAVSEDYTGEHLAAFLAVADAVDSLKTDPRDNIADLSALTSEQRTMATSILLALVTAHELTQAHREGVHT